MYACQDSMTYKPTNRDKKKATKKGLTWCRKCDAALVGEGQRCPVCGMKKIPRKNKKDILPRE